MLPNDIDKRIARTFNRNTPSTTGGMVAHASRSDLVEQVYSSLVQVGTSTLIFGHMGVGKTSLLLENVDRLLGPERLSSPFVRRATIQGSSLAEGLTGPIVSAVSGFDNSRPPLPADEFAEDKLADLLTEARTLLIVENLQDITHQASVVRRLFSLIKHLGDNYAQFPNAKIALLASLPYEQLGALVPEGRFPIEMIDARLWEPEKLAEILHNGAEICNMVFHSDLAHEIVTLSCGNPAVLHVLAKEVGLQAVKSGLRQRQIVTRQDLEEVLTPYRIRQLADKLHPGANYLGHLQSMSPIEQAVIGFSGRTGTPFSVDEAADFFGNPWGSSRVSAALVGLETRGNSFIAVDPHSKKYFCKSVIGASTALLYLRTQTAGAPHADPDTSRLYEALTKSGASPIEGGKPRTPTLTTGGSIQTQRSNAMITILFLGANPENSTRLRLDEEAREIDQALRQTDFRDRIDLKQHWAIRITDIQGYLLRHKPDIVQFSGHGSKSSEIIMEDFFGKSFPVSARALSHLFSLLKDNLRCVVLNACYSELQAQAIANHVDCVIGMSKSIGDRAAIDFSRAFYQALGYGRDVMTAFELARNAIDLGNLGEQDTPVLLATRCNPRDIVLIK